MSRARSNKGFKSFLYFLLILFFIFLILYNDTGFNIKKNPKININKNIKDNNLKDSYKNFWNSVAIYTNYFTHLPIFHLNNSILKKQNDTHRVFQTINKFLFINRAVLLDPNIFTAIISNFFKEEDINKIFELQDVNRNFIMSFALEIKYLSKFFKVISIFFFENFLNNCSKI